MENEEKVLNQDDYESLITERPQDVKLKEDFAFYLADEIYWTFELVEQKQKQNSDLFKKLKTIVKEISLTGDRFWLKAYVAFIENDRDTFLTNIINWIKKKEDTTYNNNDDLAVNLFYPFRPPFEGQYKNFGDEFNQRWPGCSAALTMFGLEALLFEKDEDKAIDFLSRALEKDENAWLASWHMAGIYHESKIWKAAAGYYIKALKSETAPRDDISFSLAWCYGQIKDYKLEENSYRNCLSVNPDYPYAQNNLGWSLYKQKRFDESLDAYNKSIDKGNDGTYPYRNKVDVLKKLGRYDEAIEFVKECIPKKKLSKSYDKEIDKIQKLIVSGMKIDQNEGLEEGAQQVKPQISTTVTAGISKKTAFSSEQRLEEELEAKIINNDLLFGKRLKIYETDLGYGRQFVIPGIGRMDLLTQEIGSNDFYIIELKKGKGDDQVIGQTARYMGWVNTNLVKNNENVFGIICVNHATEKLRLSAQISPNIRLFQYGVHTSEIK